MNTTELSSLLRTIISTMHKVLRKKMSPEFIHSMTELETMKLLINRPSLLPTELAAITQIKTQSMSQILKKMDEDGIIKRTPSKDDKRKVYISLSSSGRKMVKKARKDKDEWLRSAIEKSLTSREIELLEKALPVLTKLIGFK